MRSMVEGALRAPQTTIRRARDLRAALTLPEILLWQVLRRHQVAGLRFRRQHPIGPFVLDFYCPTVRLAVEIDGVVHDHPVQAEHDTRRDAWLSRQGIQTLRFPAADVLDRAKRLDVEATILARARALHNPLHHAPRGPPLPRVAGEDMPGCESF